LVRTTNDVNEYVDTVFWTQVARCALQASVVYVIAPTLCGWMHAPDAVALVRVSALWLVLRGFVSPGQILATRELQFEKIFAINVTEAVVAVISSAVFGLMLRSAWAIIAALLTAQLAATVASYWVAPFRPRFVFNVQRFKELSSFGRWVTATNAAIFLSMEADKFLVSRYFGPTALGFYSLAAKIASIPRVVSAELVAKVALPMFAKLQSDRERLERTFRNVEIAMVSLGGLIALIVALVAYPSVEFFLGAQWTPIITLLLIMPFAEAIRATTIVGGVLFYACNYPQFRFYLNVIRLTALCISCWVLSNKFGVTGIALSVLASNLVALPYSMWCASRILRPTNPKVFARGAV
jgi:O-antigen/teichoic acid export membrane protein